jgi:intracellular septation protein
MKKLLFDLFPVIVFFIAYKLGDANAEATRSLLASLGLPQPTGAGEKPGIYLATLVAIVASFGQIGWVKLRGGKADTMLWVSLGIIVLFGGATLWLHDENFIKWKPTVLYWVFATAIFGAALFGRNLIRSLMNAQMELPEVAWSRLNASWGGFFAFMGLANLYVAFNYSTDTWVDFKLFGSLGLMLVFVVGQSMMLTRYLDKADLDKKEKQ